MQKLRALGWTLFILMCLVAAPFVIMALVIIAICGCIYFVIRVCQSEDLDPPSD